MSNQRQISDSGIYVKYDAEEASHFIGHEDDYGEVIWTKTSESMYNGIITALDAEVESLIAFVYEKVPNNLSPEEALARDEKYIQINGSAEMSSKDKAYAAYQRELLTEMYDL